MTVSISPDIRSTAGAPAGPSKVIIRSLGPVMGAEIIGADLSQPMSGELVERLGDAFNTYKVLVFRDQHLDKAQFIAFSRLWGPLGEHIMPGVTRDGIPEIAVASNAGADGKPSGKHPDISSMRWHTDRSYMPRPAFATLLYGLEIPSAGGDTLFANTTAAYDALPEEMKRRIDPLIAIHSVEYSRATGGGPLATEEELRRAPPVKHPLARIHPATGRRAIYGGCHAWKVESVSDAEGRELLDYLVNHAVQDRFVYRHKWRQYDLVMWDDRCTFHAATPYDTAKELRVMYRTIIEGTTTS
jgi:taurine dioxygenase